MKKSTCITVFLLVLIPCLLSAQPYPTKPINVLIGYAPGGTVDVTMRLIAAKAEKILGQPLVLTNNGAGGGSVALGIVAKERPDGYHLVDVTTATFALIPQYRAVAYKLDDFMPVLQFGTMQTGLVVKADAPWKTMKDFVDYAKKNPGKVTYGIPGVGLVAHLAMEYVAKQEGIQWTYVPFPGMAPNITALLGGHITVASGDQTFIPYVQAGTLRVLGVHGENRMPGFRNVPTFIELGYDFRGDNAFIVAAPKAIASAPLTKLNDAFHKAMGDPEFLQLMEKMGFEVAYRDSAQTKRYLEDAYVRFGKLVTDLKLPKEGVK
jgi:tripartite-type tricarboxylate transporter receptor subunit TctC